MTIKELLQSLGTLQQYSVLEQADVLLADRCGRYFGGQLTREEIQALTPKEEKKVPKGKHGQNNPKA